MIGSIVKYPPVIYKSGGVMGSSLITTKNKVKLGMIIDIRNISIAGKPEYQVFKVMCSNGSFKISKGQEFKILINFTYFYFISCTFC